MAAPFRRRCVSQRDDGRCRPDIRHPRIVLLVHSPPPVSPPLSEGPLVGLSPPLKCHGKWCEESTGVESAFAGRVHAGPGHCCFDCAVRVATLSATARAPNLRTRSAVRCALRTAARWRSRALMATPATAAATRRTTTRIAQSLPDILHLLSINRIVKSCTTPS